MSLLHARRESSSFLPTQHASSRSGRGQYASVSSLVDVEAIGVEHPAQVFLARLGLLEQVIFCVGLPVFTLLTLAGAVAESNLDFLFILLVGATGFVTATWFSSSVDTEHLHRTAFSRTPVQSQSSILTRKKLTAVALQLAFVTCQLTFPTPLSQLTVRLLPSIARSSSLVASSVPLVAMFGVAAVWGQLERVAGWVAGGVVRGLGGLGGLVSRSERDVGSIEHGQDVKLELEERETLALTNETLSKYESGDYGSHRHHVTVAARAMTNHSRAESDMSISPHESWSSLSSGELSGMPSPTGVVREVQLRPLDQKGLNAKVKVVSAYDAGLEEAYLQAMGVSHPSGQRQDDTIYLFKYDVAGVADDRDGGNRDLDRREAEVGDRRGAELVREDAAACNRERAMDANTPSTGCLFVHKKLSPIKTKASDVQRTAPYRPLLRTLIQSSKDGVKRDHRHIPAVRSVAKGEGEERMEGIRMLPTGIAVASK